MLLFLKSESRAVHEHPQEQDYKINHNIAGTCISLTVWRKSLLLCCKGFTVIDCYGNLVFRVDNYPGCSHEVTLMDGSGNPILSMRRRKRLELVQNWLVYQGEIGDVCSATRLAKNPLCCVKKHKNILQPNVNVLAHIYRGVSDKRHAYVIEGSYSQRSCKVLDESRRVVAEIKKKEAKVGGESFGLEVFHLIVWPGFNSGFAMAIVLLLDQMFS